MNGRSIACKLTLGGQKMTKSGGEESDDEDSGGECFDDQSIVDDEDSPFSDEDTDEYFITGPFDDAYKKATKISSNTTGKLRRQGK